MYRSLADIDASFTVGSVYRNLTGSYKVLELNAERLRVQYEDGSVHLLSRSHACAIIRAIELSEIALKSLDQETRRSAAAEIAADERTRPLLAELLQASPDPAVLEIVHTQHQNDTMMSIGSGHGVNWGLDSAGRNLTRIFRIEEREAAPPGTGNAYEASAWEEL